MEAVILEGGEVNGAYVDVTYVGLVPLVYNNLVKVSIKLDAENVIVERHIPKRKPSRKRNLEKATFGRVLKKKRKRTTATPSFIASCISTDANHQATISSLSLGSDQVHNFKRNLNASKKQVMKLKDKKKKFTSKNYLLTNNIIQMNKELLEEKKAVNTLLAQSRKENHDILTVAKTSIKESETVRFQNTLGEKKLEQRANNAKIIRKERTKHCKST